MRPFLCCSPSTRSIPISPEEASSVTRPGPKNVPRESATDLRDAGTADSTKHAKKLLLNETTLLPGQLPGSPEAAAPSRSCFDVDKETGVPLLEDTLCCSTNARSYISALGNQADAVRSRPAEMPAAPGGCHFFSRLHIPAHLQNGPASFTADYRDGEQVMSPASFSEAPRIHTYTHTSGAGPGDDHPSPGSSPSTGAARDSLSSLESLWLLLQPPLLRSVSRRSGQRRLCRQFPLSVPDPPPGGPAAATAAAPAAKDAPARLLSRASCASQALRLLQQELLTAEALPCCPLLLLPHRVYDQADAVHVVYDSAGEFVDLQSYLRGQQRLSEASCRSVMRQLLQALSVLHERRWVHRNISAETVWVAEPQPSETQTPTQIPIQAPAAAPGSRPQPRREPLQPLHPTQQQDPVEPLSEAPTPRAATSVAAVAVPSEYTASHPRTHTATTATVVAATAASPSGSRNQDNNARGSCGPSRRAGGWLPAGDDDDDNGPQALPTAAKPPLPPPPPAEPPERLSCCGSTTSTNTSTGGSCGSSSAQQPQRKPQGQATPPPQQLQHLLLHVKLGGLALAVRPAVDTDTGQEGALRELTGCAYHLAPEAISGAGYGRPADVWAAGVLLYMLLTGRPPFPGANELEVMTRVLLAAAEGSRTRAAAAAGPAPGGPAPNRADDPATPRPSTRPLPSATAPPAQLPGQPDAAEPSPTDHIRSSGGGSAPAAAAASGAEEAPGGGGAAAASTCGPRQPPLQQRNPLQELVVQAVLESCASSACREVLAGMLVAEPELRLTAAELLRLPWFLKGPEDEG